MNLIFLLFNKKHINVLILNNLLFILLMNIISGKHKLNKRFGNLPYIKLWLLCIVTTPFILHYTKLLKASSTASVAQATY